MGDAVEITPQGGPEGEARRAESSRSLRQALHTVVQGAAGDVQRRRWSTLTRDRDRDE
jgi:hypothetical protein